MTLNPPRSAATIDADMDALSPVIVAGYRKSGALTPGSHDVGKCSRPFDAARDGFVVE